MLKNICVLDFSHYIPGPFASMRLADLGAEVIKVEPLSGDLSRKTGKGEEEGVIFSANNRNKKSIAVNLKTTEGLNVIKKLLKQTDVIIESFRPGVMSRLGLGYEQIKEIKEDIIYCSLSGYGQIGLMSHFGSHDLNYMALSGVLSQFTNHSGKPVHPTITMADLIGGLAANEHILAALFNREHTRKGAYIDATLLDAMIALMNTHVSNEKITGNNRGVSLISGELVSYHLYETKDGRFVSLGALETKFWENFCNAVDRKDWISAKSSYASQDNPIYEELKQLFLSRTLAEWTQFGLEIDCCLAPVLKPGELNDHPYIKERGLIKETSSFVQVATRYQLQKKLEEASYPPKLGSHTQQILKERLKLTDNKINDLKNKGVIK